MGIPLPRSADAEYRLVNVERVAQGFCWLTCSDSVIAFLSSSTALT